MRLIFFNKLTKESFARGSRVIYLSPWSSPPQELAIGKNGLIICLSSVPGVFIIRSGKLLITPVTPAPALPHRGPIEGEGGKDRNLLSWSDYQVWGFWLTLGRFQGITRIKSINDSR
jgi:hypothetical protein